jgi:hypothetical protein
MLICCERKKLSVVYGPIGFAKIWLILLFMLICYERKKKNTDPLLKSTIEVVLNRDDSCTCFFIYTH